MRGHKQMKMITNVVAFQMPIDRASARVSKPDEPRGQILLFTGVRYERQCETVEKSTTKRAPKAFGGPLFKRPPSRNAKNGPSRTADRRRG